MDNGGRFLKIDYPGAPQTTVNGIDDPTTTGSYEVAGEYRGSGNVAHGFVATVTPLLVAKGPSITGPTSKKAPALRRRSRGKR